MAEPLSDQTLSLLIGSIYDCALEPERWEATLSGLRQALDYASAAVSLVELPSGRPLLDISSYARPEWGERVRRSPESAIEIWGGAETMLRLPLGEPLVLSRLRDRALWQSNELYREWGQAEGIHDFVAIGLMRDAGAIGSLAFVRHVSAGDVGDAEVELARLFIPHVQRAMAISRLLDVRAIERARLREALDVLRCAVLLVSGDGAILHANRIAQRMLEQGDPLRDVQGMLRARTARAARELCDAIAAAAGDETRIGRRGLAIRLTEPDAAPVFAHVLPLTGSDFRTRLRPNAVAAVFVADAPDPAGWAQAVAGLFGLTRAETRLLASLLAGRRLAEAAAELGIATTTARTHLDGIFLKTGVARQAELMRLAGQVASPLGVPEP